MLLRMASALLLLLSLWCGTAAATGLQSDLRLMAMVPAESQMVAGMQSPSPGGEPDSLLLLTGNNRLDLDDFFAITGADASRVIGRVVFTAALGADGMLSEHSLLASGHFNREAILRFAESGGGTRSGYGGEAVLIVAPLARERDRFKQERWLVVLSEDVAIFGTPASVQREMERHAVKAAPDAELMERLSRLGRNAETWCLLPAVAPGGMVERTLEVLDPSLAAVAREGGSMQYGIHFGRGIEITASSNRIVGEGVAGEGLETEVVPADAPKMPGHAFLGAVGGAEGTTAVVKISRRRYEECLQRFLQGSFKGSGR